MSEQSTTIADEKVREIQEHEMPEGAPPPASETRRWTLIVVVCAAALAVATVVVLFTLGGGMAVLFGGAMLLAYICLGGMVAIVGSLERARERREIEARLREQS